jgi:diguanylate cyclase (GGDEF)-like protein/PAS domain S-box-containing protein
MSGASKDQAAQGSESVLRVLFVEDVEIDAELSVRELKKAGIFCKVARVDTEADYLRQLDEFSPEIILSDFSMPHFDGLSALAIAQERLPDTPFIFVSGTIGEEVAIESLKRGATDYILKTNLARLGPAVNRALRDVEDRKSRRKTEADLARVRERMNSILTSLRDVIWSVSPDLQQVIYVNPATRQVYGRPAEEFVVRPNLWFEVVHPEDREFVRDAWQQVVAAERFSIEHRIRHPDGSVRWVQDRAQLVRVAGNGETRVDGITTDITERKLQEEKIARLSRIQRLLSEVNSAIVRVRDREKLLHEACRIAVEDGGFKLAWVGLLDPQTLDIQPRAWRGDEGGFLGMIRLSARGDVPQGRGVSGIAMRTRRPIVVNDVANDERLVHRKETLLHGFRSFVVLPLLVGSEPVGSLYFYTCDVGFFDQGELKLLADLAGDISFALESVEKEEKLNYLAYYDVLTGLPNRQLFFERVNQLALSAQPDNGKLALLALNVQRLGVINDTLGRQAGDAVLKHVAQQLQHALENRHPASRISADTFAIVLANVKEEADIAHILEQKIIPSIGQLFSIQDQELRLSIKCGVALAPSDGTDADTLFRNAEVALKKAKASGDKYLFYASQMNARVAEKLTLENRLRGALVAEQFVLHYQPKVDIATNSIAGIEALIRWESPELGTVPPNEFIPLLEETGLILDVGHWVLKRAVHDYRRWVAKGLRPPRIAVNVSSLQLRQRDFADQAKKALAQEGGEASAFDLEITESEIMNNVEECIVKLRAIKEAGIRIAIDDFGTGYSSLSYIAKLPVDSLKIDRSFVATMANSADHLGIVSTIISLAHSLDLKVTAEGVESEEQLKLLRLLKCDEMQGYLFSPPLPPEKFESLIA